MIWALVARGIPLSPPPNRADPGRNQSDEPSCTGCQGVTVCGAAEVERSGLDRRVDRGGPFVPFGGQQETAEYHADRWLVLRREVFLRGGADQSG